MKYFRFLGLIVASCAIFFGCGNSSSASDNDSSSSVAEEISSTSKDKSSDSKGSSSSSSVEELDISNCETAKDAKLQAQISEATAAFMNMVYSSEFALKTVENYKNFQSEIANATELFSSALESQPGNCEAQLGYALATVANLVNDPEVKVITDSLLLGSTEQKFALVNIYQAENYASEVMQSAIQADSTLITDRIQGIIESNALPTVQQSLKIFKNLIDNDFYYVYEADGNTLSLGKGEFQLTAGALQATEAALTLLASYNLDASLNGSYNWIVHLAEIEPDSTQAEEYQLYKDAVNQAYHLLSDSASFLTVKDAWKTKYSSIPDMLDSAVGNVKNGLQTLLDSASSKYATSAVIAISDGEMGDISTENVKKVINVLDSVQQVIRTSITVEFNEIEIKICPKKFFSITDGIQDFFPYYKSIDYSEWSLFLSDTAYYEWSSDDISESINLAEKYAKQIVKEKVPFIDNLYIGKSSGHYITTDGRYISFEISWENCSVTINDTTGPLAEMINDTYSLNSESGTFCRMTGKDQFFAYIPYNLMPDLFYFTDAEGKKTISLANFHKELQYDKIHPEDLTDYIVFPDPTFNGVFPNMDQKTMAYLFVILMYGAGK